MEMQGQRQLAVTQQQAWDALNNPETLKRCVTGCDLFEATDPTHYNVGMAVKIGPVSAKFSGKIALTDIEEPRQYTLNFEGQGGAAGFGKGTSKVTLTPNEQGTLLEYTVNAQVGGKIAQLGQRLIDGVSKSMADDFFKKFDLILQEQYPANNEAEAASVATSPTLLNAEISKKTSAAMLPTWLWLVFGVAAGWLIMRLFS